jgi:hypothetical protein
VVFSALVPTITLLPSGNDGTWWLSMTIEVRGARRVTLAGLFMRPSLGLRVLANAAKQRLIGANLCVRRSYAGNGSLASSGFRPTVGNYEHFALLPNGLAVGFPVGQVSAPICGRTEVTVPYSIVRRYLSRLGLQLIQGVRKPRS